MKPIVLSKEKLNYNLFSRFYRLNNNGFCQVIPFVVPRKSELFQEDLYPDTVSDVPAITAEEWWEGTNKEPILVPMSEIGTQAKKVILKTSFLTMKRLLYFSNCGARCG